MRLKQGEQEERTGQIDHLYVGNVASHETFMNGTHPLYQLGERTAVIDGKPTIGGRLKSGGKIVTQLAQLTTIISRAEHNRLQRKLDGEPGEKVEGHRY